MDRTNTPLLSLKATLKMLLRLIRIAFFPGRWKKGSSGKVNDRQRGGTNRSAELIKGLPNK